MSAPEISDTKSGNICHFCTQRVAGPRFQAHVEECSIRTLPSYFEQAVPCAPRSPMLKMRLTENISKCQRKFKSLGQPIREEIVGSLKRLAWNSSKMCPTEFSSIPKRPLSLQHQDLDEKVISMIFTSKEEISRDRVSALQRSKKRKSVPDFVSSPSQESQFDKRQKGSPISPLGNLTPSPSLPPLPGTPGTPFTPELPPISPGPLQPHGSPPMSPLSTDDFPGGGLADVDDEPVFDRSSLSSLSLEHADPLSNFLHLSPLKTGQNLESNSSPPIIGGVSQFAFPAAPSLDSMATSSHKQVPLKEQMLAGQEDSTLNFDSAPSFPHHYSPSVPEKDMKEKADKLRYFIMQHQQLLFKAEQVFSSLPGQKSTESAPWSSSATNPETDVSLLTQSLDQIAAFTSQRLTQLARAAKFQEMCSQPPALSSMFASPNSFSTPYQSYAQLAREREFLYQAAVNGRADLLKRPLSRDPSWNSFLDQVLEPGVSLV